METKVAIIGIGEIGSSLAEVYKSKGFKPMLRDIDLNTIYGDVDVLNICLPHGKEFVNIVNEYIDEYLPKITIIHSTVPVGTTKQIKRPCVHSPVRGIHPNLKEGIEKFVKFIGYNNDVDLALTEEHYRELEIIFYPVKNSDSSELAKLTSTTYYGLCIAWHGEMKKMCDKHGIDFDVINKWTQSYNLGYYGLDMQQVIRPNLYPPENGIGGHCVIPNTELLAEEFKSKALDLILEYKK
jgi:UDP-N-acetyl-D-mannosaminuronate dehydrogenase